MFSYIKEKAKKIFAFTKLSIANKIKAIFQLKKQDHKELCKELEKLFYESDMGIEIAKELSERVKKSLKKDPDKDYIQIIEELKIYLLNLLTSSNNPEEKKDPKIIIIIGANGSGKTTSIAKLAYHYSQQKKDVLLIAGDTYRAAAVEQLEKWAEKLNLQIIKSQKNQDPAAVVFDGLKAANTRNKDLIIIDTAGRLHNKVNLMSQLTKILNIIKKIEKDSTIETLLTLDATTGQNAINQASSFNEFIKINGIILTKLDGTAKGGIILNIKKKLDINVKWIGDGEKHINLIPFDAEKFITTLLS